MDARPWLAVPPRGYGGVENVVATLTGELRRRGHHVVLATVGEANSRRRITSGPSRAGSSRA